MDDIDVSTRIGNATLLTPIYNASGVNCTTYSELDQVINCHSTGAVVTKSCTIGKRDGNPEPRYYHNIPDVENASINSMGIPNKGVDYYLEISHRFENVLNKPYFVSVSGLSIYENMKILRKIVDYEHSDFYVDGIELNLSCPNIIGKPQLAYDFPAFEETLRKVFELSDYKGFEFGLKMPPYFDPAHWNQAAEIIQPYVGNGLGISFLTCCNSIGNGLVIDVNTETTVIKPKEGHGGIGGDYMKPIALANVRKFYKLLDDKVDVIGCGGVKKGSDVFEHILVGAKAVQIGTLVAKNGVSEFNRILNELKIEMALKGYTSISDFRGKLKTIE